MDYFNMLSKVQAAEASKETEGFKPMKADAAPKKKTTSKSKQPPKAEEPETVPTPEAEEAEETPGEEPEESEE